ncbi:glycerol-3-phosphate acyltransferase, partial [Candidatus Margulisiibacteriota bacterium]
MEIFLIILGSYLLGSIPFSHLFPKIKGHDVRKKGTMNIGATNALVVAGPVLGALALAGDIAKGYLAVSLAVYYSPLPWVAAAAGLAAMLGHCFSIFLKFKGGKGIATMGGALLAFDLVFGIFVVLFWILLILVTRYFILSTLIMAALIPLMMWVLNKR